VIAFNEMGGKKEIGGLVFFVPLKGERGGGEQGKKRGKQHTTPIEDESWNKGGKKGKRGGGKQEKKTSLKFRQPVLSYY